MDTSGVPACAGIAGSGCMDAGTGRRIGCAFAGDKEFSGWQNRFVQAMKSIRSRPAVLAGWLFSMGYLHMSHVTLAIASELQRARRAFIIHEKV